MEWLQKNCACWYLLTQAEEEKLFSRWFEETHPERKEHEEHEQMV
jgi:hypothetical protein